MLLNAATSVLDIPPCPLVRAAFATLIKSTYKMSLRNLTDAECGRINPIVQLTSHLTSDHTFRENHGYNQPFTSEADQLVEQFLQETRAVPQTFQMDNLLQEMREIESQRFAQPPIPASAIKDHLNDDTWALQYLEDGKKFAIKENLDHESIWAEAQGRHEDLHELGLGEEWAAHYVETSQTDESLSAEAKEIQETAEELTQTVTDPKFQFSKFMKFMNQVSEGNVIIEGGKVIGDTDETSDVWIQEFSDNNKTEEFLDEKWADEYRDRLVENTQTTEDIWGKFHDEWQKLSDKDATAEHPWVSEYTDTYNPYKEYTFAEDNPMADVPNAFEIGKEKLANGDLPSAVLCFEAAAKQNPDNAEIWQYLGTTQAENEQDPIAIAALKRCIEIDPTNLSAIMALSVCYTNENYTNLACHTLANWLQNNPKYADLVPLDYKYDASVPLFMSQEQHKEVQDMFIKAVHKNPQDIDYEIQCGLGVLFNLSNEYDKAVDCFRTALQIKPDDSRLWNRLGATLANGSRSEEAVEAYHNALQISPGFIRARYNVGITCINLSAYKEAAEHFLIALNQQAKGRDPTNLSSNSQMSDTIWSTLRMCVGLLNRTDLKPIIDSRDLASLNKEFEINDV